MGTAVVGKNNNLAFLPSYFPIKLPKVTFPDARCHPGIDAEVVDNPTRNLSPFKVPGWLWLPNDEKGDLFTQKTASGERFDSVLGDFEALVRLLRFFDVRSVRNSPKVNSSFIRAESILFMKLALQMRPLLWQKLFSVRSVNFGCFARRVTNLSLFLFFHLKNQLSLRLKSTFASSAIAFPFSISIGPLSGRLQFCAQWEKCMRAASTSLSLPYRRRFTSTLYSAASRRSWFPVCSSACNTVFEMPSSLAASYNHSWRFFLFNS